MRTTTTDPSGLVESRVRCQVACPVREAAPGKRAGRKTGTAPRADFTTEVKAEMLQGDEADLFNIANNFTIRHLNEKQKGNYDSALWHSWMFYLNLSTIHVIVRLMARKAREAGRRREQAAKSASSDPGLSRTARPSAPSR